MQEIRKIKKCEIVKYALKIKLISNKRLKNSIRAVRPLKKII